ncbi:MAG TPA: hypothetical protein VGR47_16255 [Terracidiphilus sp.]|nr:hypothetical protein [Terracidiphilus sp.]
MNSGILQIPLEIAHNLFAEGDIANPGQSLSGVGQKQAFPQTVSTQGAPQSLSSPCRKNIFQVLCFQQLGRGGNLPINYSAWSTIENIEPEPEQKCSRISSTLHSNEFRTL